MLIVRRSGEWSKRLHERQMVQAMDQDAVEGDMDQEAVEGAVDGASDARSDRWYKRWITKR